ncbi:MAG: inositol monophosphatase family protein [Patescibacteria group bacterium]
MDNAIDFTKAREYLTALTYKAGDILRTYFKSGIFTQKSKGGVDFLTQADEEVDKFLLTNIQRQYPDANFLTEETAPKDYSHLKELNNLWIIDPLDGTINFSRKCPNFSISIGLVDKGVSTIGVVYVPMTKDLYYADTEGNHAYLNGSPISVSLTKNLGEAVLACDWAWGLEKRLNVVTWLQKISTKVRQIKSMGSAVADLASLAEGRIDAYMHSGLKPWDVAASGIIIEKAGGKITTPSGGKWNVFEPDILASNGIVHEQILQLIQA